MGAVSSDSGLFYLLAIWGAITVILIILLIYRGQLSNREDDQIFLAKGEDSLAAEQRTIVSRIDSLGRPIKVLYVVSGVLLVAVVVVWLMTSWAAQR
jgi:hypothetical protein